MKVILLFFLASCIFAEPAKFPIVNYALDLTRGFAESLNENKEPVDRLLLCISGLYEEEAVINDIIETIKNLDFTDVGKMVEALMHLINDVKLLIRSFDPCFDAPHDIFAIIKKIVSDTSMGLLLKVFKNLTSNGLRIYEDVGVLGLEFYKKHFYEGGYHLGDLFWVLLVKTPEQPLLQFHYYDAFSHTLHSYRV
eukprot:TRINITY_DN386_c0_g1_i4.p1 TRINITY_DN386_c0_g1~~TRINITY_DN386_c0_g1_i4.p1  ORF type:complete len:195 (-),score=15.40 TRINITY_DN386_c0_g1_i4:48-632(-)